MKYWKRNDINLFWRIDKCPTPGKRFSDKSPPSGPTRWQMPGGRGWARLELTEPFSVYVCLSRRKHELCWTHNFFILDKGCPILTWRWCVFQSRQTVSYPQKSGSHPALISRCMQQHLGDRRLLSCVREHVCRPLVVGSGGKSPESRPTLDHHLSGGGSGQLRPRCLSVADERVKVQSKSWMSNAETCKDNAQSWMWKAKT